MEFEEIKEFVNKVYDDFGVPNGEVNTIFGRVKKYPKGRLHDFEDRVYEPLFEELISRKGISSVKDLKAYYWDYVAKIHNSSNFDLLVFKKLFEERKKELKKAYFLRTQPVKCFFLDDSVGKELYQNNPRVFESLLSRLCNLNIFLFERLLKDNRHIYSKFTNEKIVKYLYEQFVNPIPGEPYDKYLTNSISTVKDFVLKRYDISRKLSELEWLLENTVFDVSKSHVKKVSMWDELDTNEQRKRMDELDKRSNQHIHRKDDIIEKYEELRNEHLGKSDLEIRELVQEWYLELTGKTIDESNIRYYLGQK